MTENPQISVLFTTYNDSRFVGDALESILNQTFSDFELLVVDDASTDNTLAIVRSYGDPRIRVITNQRNIGLARSLNAALPRCRAQLVARQDGDDISLPTRFEKQVTFMNEHPELVLLGTQDIWIDEEGSEANRSSFPTDYDEILEGLRERNCFLHSSVMFRRKAIEAVGGYRPFPACQDYDLWVRTVTRWPAANLPDYLVLWRARAGSISFDRVEEQTASATLIQRLARQRFETGCDELDGLEAARLEQKMAVLLEREKKGNRKLVASKCVELFHRVLKSNGRRAAWRYLARAIRLDPLNPYVTRLLFDTYVSRRVWPWCRALKGRFSRRSAHS